MQVDENLKTAHARDAARTGLFNFRDNILPGGTLDAIPDAHADAAQANGKSASPNSYSKRTLNEIFNGAVRLPAVVAVNDWRP